MKQIQVMIKGRWYQITAKRAAKLFADGQKIRIA
jgi:hypothetical protein